MDGLAGVRELALDAHVFSPVTGGDTMVVQLGEGSPSAEMAIMMGYLHSVDPT